MKRFYREDNEFLWSDLSKDERRKLEKRNILIFLERYLGSRYIVKCLFPAYIRLASCV
jgi:hypothetical protein